MLLGSFGLYEADNSYFRLPIMNDKNEVFCYSDVKDAKILLGAYRSEKDQLSCIVGLKTHRMKNSNPLIGYIL